MKTNFNVIQINGFRGILMAGFVVTCLAVGFIVFPGIVATKLWNIAANHYEQMPLIGIIQGVLLWGIVAVSYFTFKRNKHIVCLKSADTLSEEELKDIFESIKNQTQNDIIINNMLKARETELRIKDLCKSNIPKIDSIKKTENEEKIETK